MKKYLLHIVLFFCITQQFYSQEEGEGVVAFDIPVRNSLKFNKYTINPTFSFVREQNKYISFYNKRQWMQFENAPQTFLLSYAGRFKENSGVAIGVFQQNYGVLTTFGGVLNYAYNAVLDTDSNLTFGMNVGFYKSGINQGSVNTNFSESSLESFPSNSVITINPGINYGTGFLDFGVSINNAVAYNLQSSSIIEDNPEQSIQGHFMYTGYMNSRGFFDESKFSGLLRSEFKKEQTVISGLIMLTVPKGIWAQAGYNSLYGVSGGLGLNISSQIAIEYNYEKAIGEIVAFGSSHEVTLAYKFKNNNRYRYSGDDEEQALLSSNKSKRVLAKNTDNKKPEIDREAIALEKANARALAQEKAKEKADIRAKAAADAKAIRDARAQEIANRNTINQEDARLKAEAAARLKSEEDARLKAAEDARLKSEEDARLKAAEDARLKAEEDARLKAEAAARLKSEEDAKLKAAEDARLKAEEDARLKAEAAARLKSEEDARLKAEEDARLKAAENARLKAEEEERIRLEELDGFIIPAPTDDNTRSMSSLTKLTTDSKIEQQNLLDKLKAAVDSKNKDLKDLKEENDLSEQGIYSAPKAFKSVSAENAALEAIKSDVDNVIKSQNDRIKELEDLYAERLKKVSDKNDPTNLFYQKTIKDLKDEQSRVAQYKVSLLSRLDQIKFDTEVERKRRIKRAAYDNEEEKYAKDRAKLKEIKQTTSFSSLSLTEEDFDFGEELSSNIQIVKDVKNTDEGYYIVLAVHSDAKKRDEFLKKAVASGQMSINFFYDVNTSKYYIYYEKFDDIDSARNAIQSQKSEPYNNKRSMVKIEN